jgi:hypothetical protein
MRCRSNALALVCLAVATLSVGAPAPLFAECVRLWHNISEAKAQSTLVFSGTVTKFKPDPDGVFVTFTVKRVWKGTLARQVELPLYLTLDSFRFDQGIDYLVFADRLSQKQQSTLAVPTETAPVFYVSECGATRTLADAQSSLKELGDSKKPSP